MEVEELLSDLQPFTKWFCFASLLNMLILRLNILSPALFLTINTPSELWHFWKYIPNYTYLGKFSLNTLFELIFFFFTNNPLEKSYIPRNYGEFVYMNFFVAVCCFITNAILNYGQWMICSTSFMFALTYIYCRKYPNNYIMVFFILRIKTAYYPFVSILLGFLSGQALTKFLIGFGVGHLYIFLKDLLPLSKNIRILTTPPIMNQIGSWILSRSNMGNGANRNVFGFGQNQGGAGQNQGGFGQNQGRFGPVNQGQWGNQQNQQNPEQNQFRPFGGGGQAIG